MRNQKNPYELVHHYKEQYTHWANKELPYKVLLCYLEPDLQYLKDHLVELDKKIKSEGIPDEGPIPFRHLGLVRSKDTFVWATNYLQGILDEVQETSKQQAPTTQPPQSAEPQANDGKEIKILDYLKDDGYIEKEPSENGKYALIQKAERTVHRFIYNNYSKYEDWGFFITILDKYTNHQCSIETLKRYVREYKTVVPAQLKSKNSMENIRELWKNG